MRRSTRVSKKRPAVCDSSDEEDTTGEIPVKKRSIQKSSKQESLESSKKLKETKASDGSSSESDIENYLQKPDEIDFKSNFFQNQVSESKPPVKEVSLNTLSDSEPEPEIFTSNHSFQELNEFTKTLEETKKLVEKYEADKKLKLVEIKKEIIEEGEEDILKLLARGETKEVHTVHSSNSESSSESEKEWEEIENKDVTKVVIPKEGIQVLVELPDSRKKKKEVDVLASIKRRLNSVRKENQVLVHQAHLLCWIAHGNHLNRAINLETLLALVLSIIPPRFCVLPKRITLKYLEELIKWYRETIPIQEKQSPDGMSLVNLLKLQIHLQKAFQKEMLVYIFISVLRSLGFSCRLILSFQVEPLKPPSSDLHSVSTKKDEQRKIPKVIQVDGGGDSEDEKKPVRNSRKSRLAYVELSSDDDDFEKPKKKRKSKTSEKQQDGEFRAENKAKVGKQTSRIRKKVANVTEVLNTWLEVFLEHEEKWISVDVVTGEVNCPSEISSRASQPITYVVAWNNDGFIRDVTQRYCPNWNTETRKLRVDKKWWRRTMRRFTGKKTLHDRKEEEEFEQLQLQQPLPTRISDFKNHPLYVLSRHLLKYEALYPPNPTVLGYIRKEPVYSRDCVKILQSRENWYREAKAIKDGEHPYKVVKCQKLNRKKGVFEYNIPQEIFGEWQTEDFVPPAAENGIVPKNDYGNVDLYKPSMLPKGTVQVHLPGLHKVAKKLNIDCPQAMIAFDRMEWAPVFDGYVVCEEDVEILTEAWNEEQKEIMRKEREKIENRVYENWRKLTRGLLITQKLQARYNFGESSKSAVAPKTTAKTSKFTCRKPKPLQ